MCPPTAVPTTPVSCSLKGDAMACRWRLISTLGPEDNNGEWLRGPECLGRVTGSLKLHKQQPDAQLPLVAVGGSCGALSQGNAKEGCTSNVFFTHTPHTAPDPGPPFPSLSRGRGTGHLHVYNFPGSGWSLRWTGLSLVVPDQSFCSGPAL